MPDKTAWRRVVAAMICAAARLAHADTPWSESTHQLAFGDFNGDGRADVLYVARDHTLPSGIALSDGTAPSLAHQSWASNHLGIPWHGGAYRAFVADFNGDSRADILLQRQSPGDHYLLFASASGRIDAIGQTLPYRLDGQVWSADAHRMVIGDFDGNGRADVFLQASLPTGQNAVYLSDAGGRFARATQTWGNTHMGFRWSVQDAVVHAGRFDDDSRWDLLVQARPDMILATVGPPMPVPIHRRGGFGIVGARAPNANMEIFRSPALQIWDRFSLGVDWSAGRYEALVGNFDGANRDDILLQARGTSGSNRLLRVGANGQVSAGNVLPAGSALANAPTAEYRLHAAGLGNAAAAGVYLQSAGSAANQVVANVLTGTTVAHDPNLLNMVTPGTAVGAISGEFSVDASGAANYQVTMPVPPGVAGLAPELSLAYSSRGGNGLVGVGWQFAGLSAIARCATTVAQDGAGNADGVDFDGNDAFCLDGQRLVAVSGTNGSVGAEYRTELETHQKVVSSGGVAGDPGSFTVWDKAGLIREYGTQSPLTGSRLGPGDSRFEARLASGAPGPGVVWAVKVIRDRFDNFIEYRYEQESTSGASWPVEITYGSQYSGARTVVGRVALSYTSRSDVGAGYLPGGYVSALTRRLQKIAIFGRADPTTPGANDLVRQYHLDYQYSPVNKLSHLVALTLCDGGQGASQRCFRQSAFQWQYGNRGFSSGSVASSVDFGSTVDLKLLDADGDGRGDYVYRHAAGQNTGQWLVRYASLAKSKGGSYMATGIDRKQSDRAFAIDWNNDGYGDLVDSTETVGGSVGFAGAYRVLLGGPRGFDAANVAVFPALRAEALTYKALATVVGDFDGDGRQDVAYSPSSSSSTPAFMSLLKARLNNAVNPAAGLEAGTEVSTVLGYVGPPPYVPPPGIAWRHDASYLGAVEYDPADFKTEPGLYVINFDGDGRDDLLARVAACYFRPSINGSGTTCVSEIHVYSLVGATFQRVWGMQMASGLVSHLKTGDFNGDGLTDLLSWGMGFDPQAPATGWHLDLGTGSKGANGVPAFKSVMAATATSIQSECSDVDFNYFRLVFSGTYSGSNCTEPATVTLTEQMLDSAMPFDYNRDGYTDLILERNGNWQVLPGGPSGFVQSFLNTGRAARQPKHAVLVDDGGDGLPDILFPWGDSPENNWHIYYARGPAVQSVIERITDGLGAQTTIQYLPLTATVDTANYTGTVYKGHTRFAEDPASATEAGFRTAAPLGWPHAHAAGPIPVVHQFSSDNGLGLPGSADSAVRTTYEYWGLKIHREGRGSLGFSEIRSWNDNTETETRSRFAQKAFPTAGMLLTSEQRSRDLVTVNSSLAAGYDPNAMLLGYAAACDQNPQCAQLNPTGGNYDASAGYKRVRHTTNVLSGTVNTYGNGARTFFPYIRKSTSDTHPVSAGAIGEQPHRRVVSEYLQSSSGSADSELAAGVAAYDAFGNPGSLRITTTNGSTGGTAASRDEHVVLSTSTFTHDVANWCLARLTGTSVTHVKPAIAAGNGHAPVSVTKTASFTYQPGNRCVLLTETTEPASDLRMTRTYAYDSYGNRFRETVSGHGVALQDERTSGSMLADGSSSFAATQGQFPTETRNARGHAELTRWDGRFGLVTLVTDANGQSAATQLDSFGREQKKVPVTSLPAAYTEQTRYWCVNTGLCRDPRGVVATRQYSADGKESWVEQDRLGRAVATRERGFDGEWIAAEKYFDPLGREYLSSKPYKPAVHSTRCWNFRKFDVLDREILGWSSYASAECTAAPLAFGSDPLALGPGRVTEVVHDIVPLPGVAGSQGANGVAQRIIAQSTDSSSYATTRVSLKFTNVMDRTRFVQEALTPGGCAAQGAPMPASTATCLQTEYDHDAQGNLTYTRQAGTLGDGANAAERVLETRMWFNLRGLKTRMSDPDMGEWTYAYNAFGELIGQTDAKGQLTEFTHDVLGRVVRRIERQPGGAVERTSNWQFDTAPGGLGKLASVTASDGFGEWHAYDALGRPSEVRRVLAGSYFHVTQTYDGLGRPDITKYPGSVAGDSSAGPEADANRLRVRNHYNAFGFLASVTDVALGTVYWRAEAANEKGVVTAETLGNGLTTRRYFDRASGHLVTLETGSSSNEGGVQDLEFAFDQAANLRMRKDASPGVNGTGGIREEYGYDALYRLVQMRQYKPAGAATGSPALIQDYRYDLFGNLLSKGGSFTSYCYNSQAAGSGPCAGITHNLPHAPRRVIANGAARDYSFDANGQVIAASNAMYDTVSWYASNLARRITKGGRSSEFAYTPDGARYRHVLVRAAGDSEETLYVGSLFERQVRSAGGTSTTEHTHYVRAGANVVAIAKRQRTGAGAVGGVHLRYAHRDHLGSIVSLTDAAGRLVERSAFDPWGKRTSYQSWDPVAPGQHTAGGTGPGGLTTGMTATRRGYTGHEQVEELGFVHMNGRIYDPELGRFFSPDPTTQFPESTQGLNRYAYAGNNPLTNVDPSGFSFAQALGVFGQILQFVPGAFWVSAILNAVSGFMQGGFAGGLLSMASTGAAFLGIGAMGGLPTRLAVASGQTLISSTILGVVNGYQVSLGQALRGSLKSLPGQLLMSVVTAKVTEYIQGAIEETRAARARVKQFLVEVEELALQNASSSAAALETVALPQWADTTSGWHYTYIHARSKFKLRKAVGWEEGEQVVFFGKRPLRIPGFKLYDNGPISDPKNVEFLHEEVFWFDGNGDLSSIGYGPHGIGSDLASGKWDLSDFTFTKGKIRLDAAVDVKATLSNLPPARRISRGGQTVHEWTGADYNFFRHNCQDFVSASENALKEIAR